MLGARPPRELQPRLVVLRGSWDLARREELAGLLFDLVRSPRDVIVDLREAGLLDHASVEMVWQCAERLRTRGCALAVVTASAATLLLLEASGIPGDVSVCETVEAARCSLMSIPEAIT
jgi:MFS superfamily sulfate permease-like transporter